MKILISYASAGGGHRQAAQSLYNYFKENYQNLEIKIIDALQKTNPLFKYLYSYNYQFLVNHALWLWQAGFWFTDLKSLRQLNKFIIFVINRLNTINFSRYLIRETPDFIISTHFLPQEVSAYLKRNKKLKSKIVTTITDFGVHPFWISKGTDLYVVASGLTKNKLILQGVREDKIREFGIPVESKFLKKYDKDVLCKKFDIEKNKFTVLIVTGSFGIGPIEKIIDLLYKVVQILVICAHNKKLYMRLKNKNYPNVKVYGFVDNIQEFMFISDIIITKPGGLSISEVLVMELVPIFISPIPGQETENIRILEKYKIGVTPKKIKDIKDIILDYKECPDKLEKVKERIRIIKKPLAAQELCHAICQNSIWSTH